MTTGSVLAPGKTMLSGNFDGTAVLWSLDSDWSTTIGTLGSAATAALDPAAARVVTTDGTGAAVEIVPTNGTASLRLPATPRAVSLALDGAVVLGRMYAVSVGRSCRWSAASRPRRRERNYGGSGRVRSPGMSVRVLARLSSRKVSVRCSSWRRMSSGA